MKDTTSTRTLDFDLVAGRYVTRPKEPRAQGTRALQTAVITRQARQLPTTQIVRTGESDDAPVDSPEPIRRALERIAYNTAYLESSSDREYNRRIRQKLLDDVSLVRTLCRQQAQLLSSISAQLAAHEFEEHVRRAVEQRLQNPKRQRRGQAKDQLDIALEEQAGRDWILEKIEQRLQRRLKTIERDHGVDSEVYRQTIVEYDLLRSDLLGSRS